MIKKDNLTDRTLDKLKNKRLIAYTLVFALICAGVASFGESISKIYSMINGVFREGATPVVLPKDTGWLFAGYFDQSLNRYIEGPYIKTVKSPYKEKESIPRIGDWLKITSERNIIIADFETKGLTRRFDPPWQQNELRSSDYTGLKLPVGAVVEVRDVSLGAYPGKAAAVWIRIGVAH